MQTKTVKFGLIYCDENEIPYIDKVENPHKTEDGFRRDGLSVLFQLQRETRAALNAISSEYKVYLERKVEYAEKNGEYPKSGVVKGWYGGKAFSTYLYHVAMGKSNYISSSAFASLANGELSKLEKRSKDILRGDMAIPSYGKNQPIQFPASSVSITETDGVVYIEISMLSNVGKKKLGVSNAKFLFRLLDKDRGTRSIINRCMGGEYKAGKIFLKYDERKKMWFAHMAFSFPDAKAAFDPSRILGMDLGVVNVACYKVGGEHGAKFVRGGEIEHFRATLQARKRSIQQQRPYAGDGSIGHGYDTRLAPVLKIGDKEAKFRDTYNHKISRAIVDYAADNGCGTIQMEDLTGISTKHKFLKDWPYFDLQTKIEYKAKERGISVIKVPAAYTSQRCSKCGFICEDNVHDNYRRFTCQSCGYDADSDYNAAVNISMQGIGDIIKESQKEKKTGANRKPA